LGDSTAGLGFGHQPLKGRLIYNRDLGGQGQFNSSDIETASRSDFQGQSGFGIKLIRNQLGTIKDKDRNIVKQPAWAAAISSSGLVPFCSAKRLPYP
jgi:hypothetical protein